MSTMSIPHSTTRRKDAIEERPLSLHPRGTPSSSTAQDAENSEVMGGLRRILVCMRTIVAWFLGAIFEYNAKNMRRSGPTFFLVSFVMLLSVFASLGLILSTGGVFPQARVVPQTREKKAREIFFPPDIQNNWAPYTPYFPAGTYRHSPEHCNITQVNIIQRHGARFPTSGATSRIKAAVKKLQSASHFTDSKLDFLKTYTYALGQDDLLPFGAFQSTQAGQQAYERYFHLVTSESLPFVRASSSSRVVDSATNWTTGFSIASGQVYQPVLSVIQDEKLNDTLDDAMCPNAGSSDAQTNIWASIYGAPVAARLNSQAPGANLTAADISNLIPLCAFETQAKEAPSPFCNLFSTDEFAGFEYFGDLDKFYGTGYGQPLGPVQGVGYINELLARLTETPVRDNTQTNRTLDASPVTFPLNRTIYADFSHDNQMVAIYAAMGLFRQYEPLDPMSPDPRRTWITSKLTPFSARMVVERLTCSQDPHRLYEWKWKKLDTFVRVLVNDALQNLNFCDMDEYKMCQIDNFVYG